MSDVEFDDGEADVVVNTNDTKRVFINHVDTYNGKNIGNFLSKCKVGASLDGGEEEAAAEEETLEFANKPVNTFKIYGTLKNYQESKKPDFVKEIIRSSNKERLLEHLMECDVIIYDIIHDPEQVDEACWAISALHSELERIDKPKTFILLSTVLTWAKTKPADPEEPDIPFTEEDFRRRKCHPNYKDHLAAEKTVIKFGKTNKKKLSSYVVCSGLVYGLDENIYHYMFKSAWHNNDLEVYGNGRNVLPSIHVNDLSGVLQNICDKKPKVRYLLAVDDSKVTLRQITKAVSKAIGTNKLKNASKEDAMLNPEISQSDFDMLLLDLRMDAAYVKENMQLKWQSETGFVENVGKMVKEYKTSRNLVPFKICILGPPGVGKTTIASQLAAHYKIHHIHMKDVVTQAIDNLNRQAKRAEAEADKPSGGDENEEQEEEEEEDLPDLSELETINDQMENNNGRLDDALIVKFFKEKLSSKACQNQGFIIDGFPKTREQAQALFEPDGEDEGAEEEGGEEDAKEPKFNKLITPEIIIKLDANDDFLCKRIMSLPEKLVQDTHNNEEGLSRRLLEYRENNNEDNTVLNVFEEDFDLEVLRFSSDVVEMDKSFLHKKLVDSIKMNNMKEPRNYGLTAEEKAEMKRVEVETKLVKEREARQEKERLEAEEAAERVRNQLDWNEKLEKIKKEELEYLETQSVPLRNYLMTHVMPTLTKGLIECCKQKPEDPIDYLAEFLFKNNPQVD